MEVHKNMWWHWRKKKNIKTDVFALGHDIISEICLSFSAPLLFQMQHELRRRFRSAQTAPKFCLCRQLHDYGQLAHEPSTEDQISDGHTDDGASGVEPGTLCLRTANDSNMRR